MAETKGQRLSLEDAVERQFSKVFSLPKSPDPDEEIGLAAKDLERWEDPEMMALKADLNATKSLLNDLPLSKWHHHTRCQNPAGTVIDRVRKLASKPELLTQAWCKFTEILCRYHLIVDAFKGRPLKTAHLCEAPGAFITALNHHLISSGNQERNWEWMGSTFNPYHEANPTCSMVNDDRFLLHSLDRWDFGVDGSGDLCQEDNLRHLIDRMGGNMDIITSDGSVDCQADPAQQEVIVARLHLAEVTAAIGGLKDGGHFVLKMFTFYECETIGLMYLLINVFNKVDVFKPATSKEGNSEVYVVCKDFRKSRVSGDLVEDLISRSCSLQISPLFAEDVLGDKFMSSLKDCAVFFKNLQAGVIQRNLETFRNRSKVPNALRREVANEFLRRYDIGPIPKERRIVVMDKALFRPALQLDPRVEPETFQSRFQQPADDDLDGRIRHLRKKLNEFYDFSNGKKVGWSPTVNLINLEMKRGAKIDAVVSSKFCPSRLIELYSQICDLAEFSLSGRQEDWPSLPAKRVKITSGTGQSVVQVSTCEEWSRMYTDQMLQYLPDVQNSVKILNFRLKEDYLFLKSCLLSNGSVTCYLLGILDTLPNLDRGSHLLLCNFPLLTRLLVGIIVTVSSCFEEVGFLQPENDVCGIFLSEFKGDASEVVKRLEEILDEVRKESHDELLEVLPIRSLCEDPLYSNIVTMNYTTLKERGYYILNRIF